MYQASQNILHEQIARVCHAANAAYCLIIADIGPSPTWEESPQEHRESIVSGVVARMEGGLTPEQMHNRWMASKVASGWTYGQTKSFEAKTHPCLVPYNKLHVDQRRKDDLFSAIVDALTKELPENG